MDSDILISIIVPVYNVEKYLERCIKTLVTQDINNYEILLVDDGSKDNSAKLCDMYSDKYQNIRVFHKKNEGLGLTRNYGMEKAIGKYIIFVDSDDYIKQNSLGDLCSYIVKNNYDVCFYKKCVDNERIIQIEDMFPKEKISAKDLIIYCIAEPLKKDTFEIGAAWKAIYKKEFLENNSLKFESERIVLSEDYVFSGELCSKNPRVGFYDEYIYYYCYNGASLTNSFKTDRPIKAVNLFNRLMKIVRREQLSEEAVFRIYNTFVQNILISIKHIYFNVNFDKKEKIQEISKICNSKLVNLTLKKYKKTDNVSLSIIRFFVLTKQSNLLYLIYYCKYKARR